MLTTDPRAPTAVRDPRRALDDHLADSLVALELDEVRSTGSIADIGAGAGLPGLPLAIALPRAEVTLVESNGRKCEFIARAIDACGLANARVACVRAEAWPDGRERFDLVTARALAPLPVVAEYAAPLLRLGRSAAGLAWPAGSCRGGRRPPAPPTSSASSRANPSGSSRTPERVNRHLQLLVKTGPTPARFPRRPGMARKRPLGGKQEREST